MLKEEDSITDDVSVDNEMTNKLAAENKELYVSFCNRFILLHYKFMALKFTVFFFPQDLVDLLEKKVQETEKKYEEASKLCEERLQQVVDAETKLIGLKTSMQM